MKMIPLSKGKAFAQVDDADYEWLTQWKWQVNNSGYALRVTNRGGRGQYVTLLMHRVILDAPDGLPVDHINRDRLDNRRSNIRVVTNAENNRRRGHDRRNRSGFRGVSWNRRDGIWQVKITVDNKVRHVGQYDDLIEAALAYNRAAEANFGEFAVLNQVG